LSMWCAIVKPARGASSVAVPGTTRRVTAGLPAGTGTTRTSATTTLAFARPELTTGLDDPHLNRSRSRPSVRGWRNPMAPGVLVARGGCPAKARRCADLNADIQPNIIPLHIKSVPRCGIYIGWAEVRSPTWEPHIPHRPEKVGRHPMPTKALVQSHSLPPRGRARAGDYFSPAGWRKRVSALGTDRRSDPDE
jgi:hypothetical protein